MAGTFRTDSTVLALLAFESNLFAGTAGDAVFRSTNHGTSWTAVNQGLPRETYDSTRYVQITSFAAGGQNLFTRTNNSGVFLSTNNGTSWTEVTEGLPREGSDSTRYVGISDIIAIGQNIFAGTYEGVYISTNNGATWSAVNNGLTNPNVRSLGVSGTNLLAGTYDGGIFLSSDSAAHWSPVNGGLPSVPIECLASYGQSLLAATYDGVYRSTNSGTDWNTVNNGLLSTVVYAFDLARDVKDVGLVGISVDSKTARRSYDIAAAYRRRGVPVVLGGIHPSACPDEARAHADAIVVGEADDIWPTIVADAKRGTLAPVYRPPLPDLAGLPRARRDVFPRTRRYVPFEVTQTMRGCPYPCEFCSASTANGTTMRFRPADDVLDELATMGKLVMFADDNVMIHRAYSRDLFTRMEALDKHWVGQCSLAAIRRIENVALMARSGCKALFVGFESVDEETTRFTGKRQNRPAEYKETIAMLHAHGISVWGSFVFGFEQDAKVADRYRWLRDSATEADWNYLSFVTRQNTDEEVDKLMQTK